MQIHFFILVKFTILWAASRLAVITAVLQNRRLGRRNRPWRRPGCHRTVLHPEHPEPRRGWGQPGKSGQLPGIVAGSGSRCAAAVGFLHTTKGLAV